MSATLSPERVDHRLPSGKIELGAVDVVFVPHVNDPSITATGPSGTAPAGHFAEAVPLALPGLPEPKQPLPKIRLSADTRDVELEQTLLPPILLITPQDDARESTINIPLPFPPAVGERTSGGTVEVSDIRYEFSQGTPRGSSRFCRRSGPQRS